MATEMAAASNAEPGTLMYDWYVNEDGTSGVSTVRIAEGVRRPCRRSCLHRDRSPLPWRRSTQGRDVRRRWHGRADVLKATTTWWGEPVAAVTD